MSDDEEKEQTNQENTEPETDSTFDTEADESAEKTTDETTNPKRRLFGLHISNKMIVIIAATILISLLFIIIIIIVFSIVRKKDDSEPELDLKKSIAKVKAKCEEYTQLLECLPESPKRQLGPNNENLAITDEINPYMVYLLVFHKTEGSQSDCTGTLISEYFVLTVASCFKERDPTTRVHVYLGIKDNELLPSFSFFSTEIYIHEKYGTSDIVGDIALVRMSEKVLFTNLVRPICLNTTLENTAADLIFAEYGIAKLPDLDDKFSKIGITTKITMDEEVQKKCLEEITAAGVNRVDFTKKMFCRDATREELPDEIVDTVGGPLMYRMKHKCLMHGEIAFLSKSKVSNTRGSTVIHC
ncbi:coagulation factor XI-like isoform X2 [Planococcus citri]|uniref:coagulation factor XI-like isoform X2 n=1 Tax=Planococcus citri TaxID=170843 RepID=UPI0031F804AB